MVHSQDPDRIVLRMLTTSGDVRHYVLTLEGFTRLALQLAADARHVESGQVAPGGSLL